MARRKSSVAGRAVVHNRPMLDAQALPDHVVTERLELRAWTRDEAAVLCAAVERNLEHLRPWMHWIAMEPLSVDERVALIDGWAATRAAGGEVVYGVFLDGEVVGGTGLHRRRGPHGLEIGYWLDRDHTGRGFATELASGLTTAALAIPGITFVEIHHDKANARSRRVPERLGYRFLGETPDEITAPGEVGIDCAWRMDAADWSG
jgi:RimJ/RimL family protein N-acetyltransferase